MSGLYCVTDRGSGGWSVGAPETTCLAHPNPNQAAANI